MSDLEAIADRVEIEALRGEFTDAVMMRDHDRGASLFTPDGVVRMPDLPAKLVGRDQIRAGASGYRACGTTSCRPPTRARSGWTATPRPAVPTSASSGASATAARS
jgi:ketosteroid isomerase-like protein